MATRESPAERGRRRGEHLLRSLLAEYRDARLARGLSQQAVARAIGRTDSQVSRLERGEQDSASLVVLAQLLSVVGLELGARAYPAGGGLRDDGQVRLIGRFRPKVSTAFTWRTEVTMPIVGDLRAWDVGLFTPGLRIGVDAETRLRDAQEVDRRVMLKLRDSGFDRAIILVANTRTNWRVPGEFRQALLANFPVPSAVALRALVEGRDPGGNAIIVL
jgi:transcriptional regulator with XRE-family HTH domain